jgi:hypothetical protein
MTVISFFAQVCSMFEWVVMHFQSDGCQGCNDFSYSSHDKSPFPCKHRWIKQTSLLTLYGNPLVTTVIVIATFSLIGLVIQCFIMLSWTYHCHPENQKGSLLFQHIKFNSNVNKFSMMIYNSSGVLSNYSTKEWLFSTQSQWRSGYTNVHCKGLANPTWSHLMVNPASIIVTFMAEYTIPLICSALSFIYTTVSSNIAPCQFKQVCTASLCMESFRRVPFLRWIVTLERKMWQNP